MDENLLKLIQRSTASMNNATYLYGSSALDLLSGRDIDAVSISSDYDNVKLVEIETAVAENVRKCNLYLVPTKVFFDDVYMLKYGGYYSHKFAFSFQLLSQTGESINAPFVFWSSELLSLEMNQPSTQPITSEIFTRHVHWKILRFRPSFIRSLMKYIRNFQAQEFLLDFVNSHILRGENAKIQLAQNIYDEASDSGEKALFRFWDEYNKHKCKSDLWGDKTYKKIISSSENIDVAIIEEYFRALQR
jgi:hypothetical protein